MFVDWSTLANFCLQTTANMVFGGVCYLNKCLLVEMGLKDIPPFCSARFLRDFNVP